MSSTPTSASMHQRLVHAFMNRIIAATHSVSAELPANILRQALEVAADRSEAEKRFPLVLALQQALGSLIGMGANAYPPGEREIVLERTISIIRDNFAKTHDEVDAMIAAIDPMRAMAREKAKAGGTGS